MLWYVCLVIILAAKSDAVNSITASEIKKEVEVNKYFLVLFSESFIYLMRKCGLGKII